MLNFKYISVPMGLLIHKVKHALKCITVSGPECAYLVLNTILLSKKNVNIFFTLWGMEKASAPRGIQAPTALFMCVIAQLLLSVNFSCSLGFNLAAVEVLSEIGSTVSHQSHQPTCKNPQMSKGVDAFW